MTKCLFNALLFTMMEIVFPALLYQKSGSVTLTLFRAKLSRPISHYDSKIKTLCRHSSSELQPFQVLKDLMETLQRNNVNCLSSLGNLPVTKRSARLGNEKPGTWLRWESRSKTELHRGFVLVVKNSFRLYFLTTLLTSWWGVGKEVPSDCVTVWNTGRGGKGLKGWR